MNTDSIHRSRVTIYFLLLIAVATRLLAACLLPNAEQDGYSYVEMIARLSANMRTGHFQIVDLFGFWLPLFQLTAAIPNVWIDNPLLVAKILSSLCGAISCVLVFAITQKLTRNFLLSCAVFVLVLCNPLHILYSAAAMTDVPHACLVLGSLYFVLQQRWIVAAVFAALAASVRLEAWTLVIMIPLIQFCGERKISWIALSILFLPPVLWLGICDLATGNPFAYFADRVRYQASYIDFYPSRRGFTAADIRQDVEYLLLGANNVAFLAIIVASGLSIFQFVRKQRRFSPAVAATAAYAIGLIGFLFAGYVTKRQPVFLPRYGLSLFVLGLPLLAWLLQLLIDDWKFHRAARSVAVVALVLCLAGARPQIPTVFKVMADSHAQQQITDALVAALGQSPNDNWRCFSDDVAVRVLSHLPPDRFLRSQSMPAEAQQNVEAFESHLRAQHAAYLVFTRAEDSLPVKFYPDLGRSDKIDMQKFETVSVAFSPFGPDVWLYRLHF